MKFDIDNAIAQTTLDPWDLTLTVAGKDRITRPLQVGDLDRLAGRGFAGLKRKSRLPRRSANQPQRPTPARRILWSGGPADQAAPAQGSPATTVLKQGFGLKPAG